MSTIKELSLNPDFKYKCDRCNTTGPKPGLCRDCEKEMQQKDD